MNFKQCAIGNLLLAFNETGGNEFRSGNEFGAGGLNP